MNAKQFWISLVSKESRGVKVPTWYVAQEPFKDAYHLIEYSAYEKAIEEVKEWAWDAFVSTAHLDKETGLWDTMALSSARDAGDKLVELGVLERMPEGAGRRWFYREVKQKNDPSNDV